jgi:hypothetical protein
MSDESSSDLNNILPQGRKDIFEATKRQMSKRNFLKAVLIFVWVFMPLSVTRRHLASLKKESG